MKKNVYRMMLIFCLFIAVIFTIMYIDKTAKTDPYEYLVNIKSKYPEWAPTECLHVDQVDDNLYLVFYKNKMESMSCALIKKSLCFYKELGYAGTISLHSNNRFDEDAHASLQYAAYFWGIDKWIYWGAIYDDTVKSVIVEGKESNIINIDKYNIKICYFLGDGKRKDVPEMYYLID